MEQNGVQGTQSRFVQVVEIKVIKLFTLRWCNERPTSQGSTDLRVKLLVGTLRALDGHSEPANFSLQAGSKSMGRVFWLCCKCRHFLKGHLSSLDFAQGTKTGIFRGILSSVRQSLFAKVQFFVCDLTVLWLCSAQRVLQAGLQQHRLQKQADDIIR